MAQQERAEAIALRRKAWDLVVQIDYLADRVDRIEKGTVEHRRVGSIGRWVEELTMWKRVLQGERRNNPLTTGDLRKGVLSDDSTALMRRTIIVARNSGLTPFERSLVIVSTEARRVVARLRQLRGDISHEEHIREQQEVQANVKACCSRISGSFTAGSSAQRSGLAA